MSKDRTQILPFCGLRYQLGKEVDLPGVTAPPFDEISKALQQTLAANPYNVVHLELNPVSESDTAENNAYTRASKSFKQWQQAGILAPEKQPAIYAYRQSWIDKETGKPIERMGIWALLEIEPYETGRVIPHEKTLNAPLADRLNLMKSTLGNFSPMFMLYNDPALEIESSIEALKNSLDWQTVSDNDQVTHYIAPIFDSAFIQTAQNLIANQQLLIADGHHRYQTAITFKEQARERYKAKFGYEAEPGRLASDYVMVYLCNIEHTGLKVFPTNRVLYQWPESFDENIFRAALLNCFYIVKENEAIAYDFAYQSAEDYLAGKKPIKLKLKNTAALGDLDSDFYKTDLQKIDTAILEHVVFQNIFKSTGKALKEKRILSFFPNRKNVEQLLKEKKIVAAFWMKEPKLNLIQSLCAAGHRMPQKSTFFFPKVLSGLVFYSYALSGGCLSGEGLSADLFDTQEDIPDYTKALFPDF